MTGRERVTRALEFQRPDRAPRDLWALGTETIPGRQEQRDELVQRLGIEDFADPPVRGRTSHRSSGVPGRVGRHTDDWGSTWHVSELGTCGEVKEPILADWNALDEFKPPWELIETTDLREVDAWYETTDRFTKVFFDVRPFERLQFLRGTENLYLDLATGAPELERLIRMLHEFFLRDIELWRDHKLDAIAFMDDWGAQDALLISPKLWREMFKPLYRDYCDAIHEQGKYVFFHSDGNIEAIYPDLIEVGVDAVNSQLFCMDIERLGELYRGKITFWGEMDRQRLLPFGTPEQVKEGVRRVRRALDDGEGGLIAQCEWGVKDPVENILAVFEAWDEPAPRGPAGPERRLPPRSSRRTRRKTANHDDTTSTTNGLIEDTGQDSLLGGTAECLSGSSVAPCGDWMHLRIR